MIIDFHTHAFPEAIAARTLDKLSRSADMPYYLNGTLNDLRHSMEQSGITYSVLLPVATSAAQHRTINETAIAINDHWQETGVFSFGAVHPDNEDYRSILHKLAENGIKGIKLHPVFQNTYIDDIRYLRIISAACENGLIVLTHAGYDISFPGKDFASPAHIKSMLDQVHPDKMVLAHMGGWGQWDKVEELLADTPVWLDTSFSLTVVKRLTPDSDKQEQTAETHLSDTTDQTAKTHLSNTTERAVETHLSNQLFLRIVRAVGEDHILFGSDSPWSSQSDSIRALQTSGLDEAALQQIFYGNASRLLGLEDSCHGNFSH